MVRTDAVGQGHPPRRFTKVLTQGVSFVDLHVLRGYRFFAEGSGGGKNMVRVGLIGFGLAGQAFHAPVIRGVQGMELACILERHTSNAKQKYPEVRIARNLDEMLSDKTIGLVVVATPNDSHFSYANACLEADRHVVVDKPFTPTMAEAEQLVRLAGQRGKLLTVYHD